MKYLATILGSLALCVFSAVGGFHLCRLKLAQSEPKVQTDTLIVYDTITAYKPIYSTLRITDTMKVIARDTIALHDTLYVYLPREQVQWQDSLSCVWASGYEPKVDSVRHFLRERVVVQEVKSQPAPSRWGIGLVAGYGAGKDGLTPFLGVGVSYSLFTRNF